MAKKVSLQQVAEEMNDVMQYGCDKDGNVIEEGERIDTELSDKALLRELKKRAKEDLCAADQESFSSEVWDWFIDNDLAPEDEDAPEAGEDEDGEGEDAEGSDDGGDDDDDGEDEKPRKAPPAEVKRSTPEKGQKGDSQPSKPKTRPNTQASEKTPEKGGERADNPESTKKPRKSEDGRTIRKMAANGNENYAADLIKEGKTAEEFLAAIKELYEASKPDAKPEFVFQRAKIYWNIGHKRLNKVAPPFVKKERPANKNREAAAETAQPDKKPAGKRGKK